MESTGFASAVFALKVKGCYMYESHLQNITVKLYMLSCLIPATGQSLFCDKG